MHVAGRRWRGCAASASSIHPQHLTTRMHTKPTPTAGRRPWSSGRCTPPPLGPWGLCLWVRRGASIMNSVPWSVVRFACRHASCVLVYTQPDHTTAWVPVAMKSSMPLPTRPVPPVTSTTFLLLRDIAAALVAVWLGIAIGRVGSASIVTFTSFIIISSSSSWASPAGAAGAFAFKRPEPADNKPLRPTHAGPK